MLDCPSYTFIPTYTFIKFDKIVLPTRLFQPTRLFGTLEYSILKPHGQSSRSPFRLLLREAKPSYVYSILKPHG